MSVNAYYYRNIEWSSGKPKIGRPKCPKCGSFKTRVMKAYPVDYTELYKDYECEECKHTFTVNWS